MMKILKLSLAVLTVVLLATTASAQASRTWVSGVGDDLNPCSRTAPCKTFAGAISKTATGGYINVLDPAGYGSVTITKSITIDGGPFLAGILASGTTGVIINITNAADTNSVVHLRNLDFEGFFTGIRGINVISAKKVFIENCKITGFRGNPGRGIDVGTTVANMQVTVKDSTITGNLAQGIRVSGPANNSVSLNVEGTTISLNDNSAVDLIQNARASIGSSNFSQNGSAGVFAEAGTTQADVAYTRMAQNIIAASALNGGVIRLYNSQIVQNSTSISGNVVSHGNNAVINNGVNTLPALVPAPALQ
ncbi:MAG: hypothetical protein JOZ54_07120 [Acidobacteria bacterium]|nr:hypothetical protein [Acidobacteriota bacterium]